MSLRSDCLLATTGVFPDQITEREHSASEAVPDTFRRRLRGWVKKNEQQPFEFVAPKDMDRLFTQLATDPPQATVAAWLDGLGVSDGELHAEFYAGLLRARSLLVDAWPKFHLDGPAGPRVLPLSDDDAAEVWSLVQVADDPSRVLDEMDARTLTASQADVFRKAFPDLYQLADDTLRDEMTARLAKDPAYDLGWEAEGVIKTLRGLPPEEPMMTPPAPVPPQPKSVIDADRDRTQAELSGSPKSGKPPTPKQK